MKKRMIGLFMSVFLLGSQVMAADCICTMQYEPVCGTDGKTYGNSCALGCAGATYAYDGECGVKDEFLIDTTIIPLTCTRRYDGCNTCSVVNGQTESCTELACFTMNRAKCVDHDFVYLKEKHEQFITEAINLYLDRATDSTTASAILLDKVVKKREEINALLMVSSFPVGSPALQRYELLLEVLAKIESILP